MGKVDPKAAAAIITAWRASLPRFAWDVFGVELWEDDSGGDSQLSVAVAVPNHRRIAVRSGHKVGKSLLLAIIALWFYALFPGARVILTAPTGRQIGEVVWMELARLYRLAAKRGYHLGGRLYDTWSRGLRHPNGSEVFGVSTNEKDRFSGISGHTVVYLCDEGSGIDDGIWEAILGNIAGGAWVITMGNPTQTDGQFFRCFHEESHLWRCFHISSERTPTARGVKPVRGLATREWVEERRAAWIPYENHPLYAIRVRGEFPGTGAMNVVSLAAVNASIARWKLAQSDRALVQMIERSHRLQVGVDVARFGDDSSCIIARRGPLVYAPQPYGGLDGPQLVQKVHEYIAPLVHHGEEVGLAKAPVVRVDVIGVGAGVYDIAKLRAESARKPHERWEVVPVNVAEAATAGDFSDDPGFANLRAQAWFAVSDFLVRGGMIPEDHRLRADLLAPRYKFNLRGERLVESKDDIKERLGRSTDHGDALTLSVLEGTLWTPSGVHVPGM